MNRSWCCPSGKEWYTLFYSPDKISNLNRLSAALCFQNVLQMIKLCTFILSLFSLNIYNILYLLSIIVLAQILLINL